MIFRQRNVTKTMAIKRLVPSPVYSVYCRHRQSDCRFSTDHVGVLLPKIKKIPKNTNGRLAIPALAGLLVDVCACLEFIDFGMFLCGDLLA